MATFEHEEKNATTAMVEEETTNSQLSTQNDDSDYPDTGFGEAPF